jgi:hypothetical protein
MPRLIVDGQIPGTGGGSTTGPVSWQTPFTLPISGVTAPTEGTKGTFATLDHPDAITTGQRFEFAVPSDYASGNLVLRAVFAMSTAVSADVQLETAAHIAKITTGLVDTATYPATPSTLTPLATTAIDQQDLKTITAGNFDSGDVVQFFVSRLGGDGADTHTGDWQVLAYEVVYTATLGARTITQVARLFQDTDETAPTAGTKGDFDTLDFAAGGDQEQKTQFYVPANWDGTSGLSLRLTFAMATAVGSSAVVISTEGEIGEIGSGSLTAIAVDDFVLSVPNSTDVTRSTLIRLFPESLFQSGDQISLKIKRKGTDGSDTHTGAFQLLSAELSTGEILASGASTLSISELPLAAMDINPVSGIPDGDLEAADLAGDFENWVKLEGNAAADRIDVSFQGQFGLTQSQITSIKVPIKGTAGSQYQLKVYAEGSGASAVYDSTLLVAPVSRTVLALDDTDLSAQPTGEGRYHVVVEATLDAAEILRVGRPLVKQE